METTTAIGFLLLGIVCGFVLFEGVWIASRLRRAMVAGKQVTLASQQSTQESARVLVIGDSTACGTGTTDSTHSLIGRLARDFPQLTIMNMAENAMNARQVRDKFARLPPEKFDMVMVHVGGMDVLTFTRRAALRRHLEALIVLAKDREISRLVLVSPNNAGAAPIFHFPLSRLMVRRSRQVSQLFEEVCQVHGVVHVPLFAESPKEPLTPRHFAPDGSHPNDEGYAIWYEKIKSTIEPHIVSLQNKA